MHLLRVRASAAVSLQVPGTQPVVINADAIRAVREISSENDFAAVLNHTVPSIFAASELEPDVTLTFMGGSVGGGVNSERVAGAGGSLGANGVPAVTKAGWKDS